MSIPDHTHWNTHITLHRGVFHLISLWILIVDEDWILSWILIVDEDWILSWVIRCSSSNRSWGRLDRRWRWVKRLPYSNRSWGRLDRSWGRLDRRWVKRLLYSNRSWGRLNRSWGRLDGSWSRLDKNSRNCRSASTHSQGNRRKERALVRRYQPTFTSTFQYPTRSLRLSRD